LAKWSGLGSGRGLTKVDASGRVRFACAKTGHARPRAFEWLSIG